MKMLVAVLLAILLVVPAVAWAGSSTDAALGLGAFAVFNQMLAGTGVFGWNQPAPVIVAPPPVVQYQPAPVYYAPPPVYYAPAPVYYVPATVKYTPAKIKYAPVKVKALPRWCPPGHAKHGRC